MKIVKYILVFILSFVGVTAVAGGVALVATNGLGMYASSVQPLFYDYIVPGLILAIIVGGTNILAAVGLMKNFKLKYELSAIAGFGLLIWIFVEIYITNLPHFLQIVYFFLGVAVLVMTMLLLNKKNSQLS